MRKVSLTAAATVLAAVGALVGVGVASAAHVSPRTTPNGTVVVAPDTGLTNGQTVTVSGSGFVAGDSVYILQCQNPPSGQSSCNIGNYKVATIDGSGNLAATSFTVSTGIFGTTTCGTSDSDLSNCAIVVANYTQTDAGYTGITFASSTSGTTTTTTAGATTTTSPPTTTTTVAPTGPRRLTAKPSTNLHGGQKVKLSGSGFTPGDHVFAIECLRTASGQKGCNLSTLKALTVNSSGHLPTIAFKVVAGKVGTGKCGTSAATRNKCDISVGNPSGGDSAKVNISFKA